MQVFEKMGDFAKNAHIFEYFVMASANPLKA
jgi:hypothetical protein